MIKRVYDNRYARIEASPYRAYSTYAELERIRRRSEHSIAVFRKVLGITKETWYRWRWTGRVPLVYVRLARLIVRYDVHPMDLDTEPQKRVFVPIVDDDEQIAPKPKRKNAK